MSSDTNADYTIHLDFDTKSKSPERVFQSMSSLTLAMKRFDQLLLSSLNEHYESYIVLNDIQGGCIKSSFKAVLKKIDDDDLRNLEWRRIIGQFLVTGKHKILDQTNDTPKIESIEDISKLILIIEELKDELKIHNSLNSKPISHYTLLKILQEISISIAHLEPKDKIELISEKDKTPFNKKFILTDEDVEFILTGKTQTKRVTLLLKVKKPDYLGNSKWTCKSQYGLMDIKIKDSEWLKNFQQATVTLLPGDSIKAIVETTILYDHQGSELKIDHSLMEVVEIVEGQHPVQMKLPIQPPPPQP